MVSTNTNTNYNNIKKFSNIINNMNEFDLIYNKNIISTKEIKQKISLDKNNNQNKLNNITNAIDNYVNNEVCKRKRLSSYG